MIGNIVAAITDGGEAATDFESIATVTGNTSGTITFSNIPTTYQHLQLRTIGRGTQSGNYTNMNLRVGNGSVDTGSNYTYHRLFGNGSSVTADGASNQTAGLFGITGASASANIFMVNLIDIVDYANTNKFKTIRNLKGYDLNGSGEIFFESYLWRSTSAITTIELTLGGGQTLNTNSHFALYGIKG
jgi:hypothetical protein